MVRSKQVMYHAVRVTCDCELVDTLRATLAKARASKKTWTTASWKAAVEMIKHSRSWAHSHGGCRRLQVKAKAAAKRPRRLPVKAKAAAKPAAAAARASGDAAVPAVGGAAPLECPQASMAAGGEADEAEVPVVDGMLPHAAAVEVVSNAGARPFGVLDFIDKGTYGRVYKAVQHKTGTIVAIKVIDIDGLLTSFHVRELAALKRLCGHPNIVSMILRRFKTGFANVSVSVLKRTVLGRFSVGPFPFRVCPFW